MDYSKELGILRKKYPIVDESILAYELDQATNTINRRRRFLTTSELFIDEQYRYLLIPLASAAIDKDGAIGQTGHSENGIGRAYDNDGRYPTALLNEIVPLVGTYTVTESSV